MTSMLLVGAAVVVLLPAPAGAAEPIPVITRRPGQFQPSRGDGFLVWQENSVERPGFFNLFGRPDEGDRFRINASGTQGAGGGIDGTRFVYQQYKKGRSDLKFFDLLARDRSSPPKRVNSDGWEYWPSMSGDWLLFGRLGKNGVRKVILFNLATREQTILDETHGKNAFAAPGQVSGDFAVWSICTKRTKCNVFRYQISLQERFRVPNPGKYQKAPSVSPQGTVYFARTGKRCGELLKLMSTDLGGSTDLVTVLPGGDVNSTRLYAGPDGHIELYYEHNACGNRLGSDIWKIVDPNLGPLQVTKAGAGSGQVTSDPSGINCGEECSHFFEMGSTVTLTATPDGGSIFGGWDGACSGSSHTCTVTIDAENEVTATFSSADASLTVSLLGGGDGTVTSDPSGINCGNDCTESYPIGTEITLTADPKGDSVFASWGGGCSGTQKTCTLTLQEDTEVTARFVKSSDLNVLVEGNGSGTVHGDPAGIDCPQNCSQEYATGTSVTLTASAAAGSTFEDWDGACNGSNTTCTVTLDQDKSVTAAFSKVKRTLEVSTSGPGSVTSDPGGINCPGACSQSFDEGTPVTLTAVPDRPNGFVGWGDACSGTDAACVVVTDQAKSVIATFKFRLTVALGGQGSGSVSSSPQGIDCGGDCDEDFAPGTVVTLTATPSGSAVQWVDCPDAQGDACTVTLDADRVVTAKFITFPRLAV